MTQLQKFIYEQENGFKTTKELLEDLRDFRVDWDGKGSSPISENLYNRCLKLVENLYLEPVIILENSNKIFFEYTNELYETLRFKIKKDKIFVIKLGRDKGEDYLCEIGNTNLDEICSVMNTFISEFLD